MSGYSVTFPEASPLPGRRKLTRNPNAGHERDVVLGAARSFGERVLVLSAGGEHEFDSAFAAMVQERIAALLAASDPFFVTRRDQVVSLVARRSIPAIYYLREFAEAVA